MTVLKKIDYFKKILFVFSSLINVVLVNLSFILKFYRQEVDGTYILELHKDEKKGDAKATIVMDFCTDVVKVSGLSYHEILFIY